MPSFQNLIFARSQVAARDMDDNVLDYLIVVLALIFAALLLISLLFVLRRRRRQLAARNETLPTYNEARGFGNHKNLTIQTTQNGRSSVFVINTDGQPMLQNPSSPPYSPDNVPEIRITFPDEKDEEGKHKDGRVLVVRVGDGGAVGLEPIHDEQLPAYEKESKSEFYSLDMDQIGGLREKEYR